MERLIIAVHLGCLPALDDAEDPVHADATADPAAEADAVGVLLCVIRQDLLCSRVEDLEQHVAEDPADEDDGDQPGDGTCRHDQTVPSWEEIRHVASCSWDVPVIYSKLIASSI